jgi:homoserine kinase type II
MTNVLHNEIEAILEQYFETSGWSIVPGESGVNNTTRFIDHNSQTYVLRIYENHCDLDKVKYEHAVLQKLQQGKLSFRVPSPKAALNGNTYVHTQSAKIAVLFNYIEGIRADLGNVRQVNSIGSAMGELVEHLEKLSIPLAAAYERYYELYEIHPLVNRSRLNAWMQEMETELGSAEMRLLRNEIVRVEEAIPVWSRLPMQLVHSDLVAGNVLAGKDSVTGILDFEFVTLDLRAMDAAVFLNEIIRYHEDRWELLEAFIQGYGQSGKMTAEEIAAMPRLILLRSIVLCIHFLGRHWAGIDPHSELPSYVRSFARVHRWLQLNESRLIEQCREHWNRV